MLRFVFGTSPVTSSTCSGSWSCTTSMRSTCSSSLMCRRPTRSPLPGKCTGSLKRTRLSASSRHETTSAALRRRLSWTRPCSSASSWTWSSTWYPPSATKASRSCSRIWSPGLSSQISKRSRWCLRCIPLPALSTSTAWPLPLGEKEHSAGHLLSATT